MTQSRRVVVTLIAGAFLVFAPLGAPTPANADSGPLPGGVAQKGSGPQPNRYPVTAQLQRSAAHAGAAVPALSPGGCYGQTDRPHLSTHVPGSVNVVARTVCSGFLDYVTTNLYRSRWYGWELRGSGNNTSYNTATDNADESAADCDGTHDYLASSYHENLDDGSYANTSNTSAGSLTC